MNLNHLLIDCLCVLPFKEEEDQNRRLLEGANIIQLADYIVSEPG